MKGYTSLERSILDVARSTGSVGGGSGSNSNSDGGPERKNVAGQQEAEIRMKLVLQRAQGELAQERKARADLEEKLFRSEAMSMKLNAVLSGQEVNALNVDELWAKCKKEGVRSDSYKIWIQQHMQQGQ